MTLNYLENVSKVIFKSKKMNEYRMKLLKSTA